MYIWTKENGMINLTHYPRVSVDESFNTYHLLAISNPHFDINDSIKNRISIIHFKDKVDADYLYWHLCRAITDGEGIWNPNEVKPLSVLSGEIKSFLVKQAKGNSMHWIFFQDAELSITDLGKLTIRYESKWESELGTSLEDHKEKVEGKLIEVLKEEYGPIQAKWESSS